MLLNLFSVHKPNTSFFDSFFGKERKKERDGYKNKRDRDKKLSHRDRDDYLLGTHGCCRAFDEQPYETHSFLLRRGVQYKTNKQALKIGKQILMNVIRSAIMI